jgi:hypothetical protein
MHNGVAGPRLPASMMENVMLCILMTPEELKVLVRSCELMQKYKLHAENRMFVSLLDRVALVAWDDRQRNSSHSRQFERARFRSTMRLSSRGFRCRCVAMPSESPMGGEDAVL